MTPSSGAPPGQDPTVNVVVFEVLIDGRLQKLAGHGPARAPDSIESAWRTLSARWGIETFAVRRLYSEWEPSEADRAFVGSVLPAGLELTYSFPRPRDEEGWEVAFAQAAAALARAERRRPWWRFWR